MMKYTFAAMILIINGSTHVLVGDSEEAQMLETKKCVACDLNSAWFEILQSKFRIC